MLIFFGLSEGRFERLLGLFARKTEFFSFLLFFFFFKKKKNNDLS